jgi:DNA repair protein RadC
MTASNPVDQNVEKTKKFRLLSIRPVFQKEVIREDAPAWLGTKCTDALQVFELFRDLAKETKEHFVSLHLDSKNRIICFETTSVGSMCASIVHPREVFKSALLSSAAAVLFVHNHPSGDPTPSREDLEITQRLKDAGELLGIRELDHVIIGSEGRYYSLAGENGERAKASLDQ